MNYKKLYAIQEANKKRWEAVSGCPITNESGIYIITRIDENGFKFAYVGQAKHILSRLAQHLTGYQHIDLSLKRHGLYSESNQYGWDIHSIICCQESELDEKEQECIKKMADFGYQLRNKTAGRQGKGKHGIDDNKPSRGYYDGLKQGEENAKKKLRKWFSESLKAVITEPKTKIKLRYLDKFNEYLGEEKNEH